jgi:hypothetical protein
MAELSSYAKNLKVKKIVNGKKQYLNINRAEPEGEVK